MTLDVSDVEAGAKQAKTAFDGISASAEKTGEQSERSFGAMLAPLERISKQLSQMGAHLFELTGLSRQNGVALAELGNQLSSISTAAVKAEKGTGSAGKALKETEEDALDFAAAAVRSNQRVAELSQELQNLTDHKKVLEQNGLGLGFRDYDQTVARIQELKAALKEYQASLPKPIAVRAEGLNNLTAQLKQAKADLKSLEGAGFGLGDANYDMQYQEVMRLTAAVKEYKASLAQAEQEPPRLSERLRQAGRSALTLGRNLASAVGGAALSGFRRIGSLVGNIGSRLLGVGRSAEASNLGLAKMVRSIRNISLVSVGMKLVSALFGRLRSVVNQYLSENKDAQAAVNSLKSAFANALAPAINIAVNALNAILPYIQAVSNAFATLFTNLFGAQWTTISGGAAAVDGVTDATKGATAAQEEYNRTLAGFDQITKLDDNSSSSGSGSGGGGGSTSTPGGGSGMLGQFSQFMTDLADMVKNGAWADLGNYLAESFGSAIDRLYDALTSTEIYAKIDSGVTALSTTVNSFFARMTLIDDETGNSIAEKTGMTLGAALNLAFHTVNSTLTTINWGQIGLTLAQMINGAAKETNFGQIGTTVANWFLTLPKILTSTISNTDWKGVASGLSSALTSAFRTISGWVKSVDWSQIAAAIKNALSGVDWGGIASSLFDLLGSALGGLGSVVGQLIANAFDGIGAHFQDAIEAAGGKIGLGILMGILKGLQNIGIWIRDNIFFPFIEGFKSAFGIHSPSTVMAEMGGYIIEGLLHGILSMAQSVTDGFSGIVENIKGVFDGVGAWFGDTFGDAFGEAQDAWGGAKKTFTGVKENVVGGFKKLGSDVKDKFESAFKTAKDAWRNAKTGFSAVSSNVVGGFSSLASSVKSRFSTAFSNAKNAWGTAKSSFTTISSNVVGGFSNLAASVKSKFGSAFTNAKSAWSTAKSGFSAISSNVVSGFSSLATNVKSKFSTAFSSAKNAWSNAKSSFAAVSSNVVGGFSNLASNVKSKFSTAFNSARTTVQNLGWKTTGKNITAGILNGMYDWGSKLKSWAKSLLGGIQKALGIASPSKLFRDKVGIFLGLGVSKGLDDSQGSIIKTATSVADSIADAFSSISAVLAPSVDGMSTTASVALQNIAAAGNTGIPFENRTNNWVDQIAERVTQKVGSSPSTNGNNRPIVVQVVLDGRVVGQTVVDYAIGVANTTGQLPWAAYT